MNRHPISKLSDLQLFQLCREHGDIELTLRDSVAAGNCAAGSRAFVRTYFPGRKHVPISEVLPLIRNDDRVEKVLRYKMREFYGSTQAQKA